ncbi:hypothetical protein ACFQ07_32760 [Actinomadura adrarensis]|uniref:Uncharacterized protein n=1 Tax=Actinomadura adrarensis TaxID=1819600 RepID=A0ABW3CTY1_9ACTN
MINERDVEVRSPSPHPLREGEQEVITWMAFDEADGVDYGCVLYTRRPSGEPVFDEPQVFTVPLMPGDPMPGNTLLRELVGAEESGEDCTGADHLSVVGLTKPARSSRWA